MFPCTRQDGITYVCKGRITCKNPTPTQQSINQHNRTQQETFRHTQVHMHESSLCITTMSSVGKLFKIKVSLSVSPGVFVYTKVIYNGILKQ